MNKKELRQLILKSRRNLSSEEMESFSSIIISKLSKHELFKKSKVIFSYMPFDNEVNILPLNKYIIEQGKSLLIPRILDDRLMEPVLIKHLNNGQLIKNHYGILEPSKELLAFNINKIDLVLVPGLAFDFSGNRLGRGRGYYDNFLEKCGNNTFLLGIAYDFQIFDAIPAEAHDKKVNGIITEKRLLIF
jgi:5-formyltetrahydrofolate cyclo-ligase